MSRDLLSPTTNDSLALRVLEILRRWSSPESANAAPNAHEPGTDSSTPR